MTMILAERACVSVCWCRVRCTNKNAHYSGAKWGLQGVQPHSGCVWPTDSLPIEPPLLYHQFTSDFVDCIQHSVYDFGVVTDHRCADICIASYSILWYCSVCVVLSDATAYYSAIYWYRKYRNSVRPTDCHTSALCTYQRLNILSNVIPTCSSSPAMAFEVTITWHQTKWNWQTKNNC